MVLPQCDKTHSVSSESNNAEKSRDKKVQDELKEKASGGVRQEFRLLVDLNHHWLPECIITEISHYETMLNNLRDEPKFIILNSTGTT